MTKREFIKAQASTARALNIRMSVWIGLFLLGIIGLVPLVDYLNKHPDASGWIARASGFVFLGYVTLVLSFMLWDAVSRQRKGPTCPNCYKPLLHFNAKIAIASGNCPECGERVFSD